MNWQEHWHERDNDSEVVTLLHQIDLRLSRIEHAMTEINADQAHLDQDVTDLGVALNTAVSELKAQIAALQAPPSPPLNFAAIDAIVASTQAEATADAPVVPPVVPPVA